MRHATKHLMIGCTLLAMLWAQVFGLQHHLFVCLCSEEPVETVVDHCHDTCEQSHQTLATDHHQDHDCDQKKGTAQHHARLKDDLKARSQAATPASWDTPVLVMLFTLPDLFVPKVLSTITGKNSWTSCGHSPLPPLSLQVHQSVVFLI